MQKDFVKGYLKGFFYKCKEKNIDVLTFFGNDDSYTTIEDDLDKIDTCEVMAIHQPPWKLWLDICNDYRAVGSKSVYEFIEKKQLKIHESFKKSGKYKEMVGNSIVIQPGQLDRETTMVYIL